MSKLFWFPDPLTPNTSGLLRHDGLGGVILVSQQDTHPSGRKGISWILPDSTPDKNGARITILQGPDYYEETFRGIVDLHYFDFDPNLKGLAGFLTDDTTSIKKPAPCPEPIPIPPIPPTAKTPLEAINAVYATGLYNLATYDGCGQFTEACATTLHNQFSTSFGHLEKFPPQNHYPAEPYVLNGKVHALDAINLTQGIPGTPAGVYDIIFSSESPEAKPAFNFSGPARPDLWYYPAK